MHETGHSGRVHWDDPEVWDGEGGGRGVQGGVVRDKIKEQVGQDHMARKRKHILYPYT